MIIETTPEKVREFGRFAHRFDRMDFYDWLEVLEFLDHLRKTVQEVKLQVDDTPREELVVVVEASIQYWKEATEKGFLGMIWVMKQYARLRQSLEKLRCALKKMGMIDPSGSPMKPAINIKFISDREAAAGSIELDSEHFPRYVFLLFPLYIQTDRMQ